MQIRSLSADSSQPSTVTLLDGKTIPYSGITFDTGNYHFTYVDSFGINRDITNNLSRSVKQTFPNFDVVTDNYRLDAEFRNTINQPGALQPLPTDTGAIFADNLVNEASFGAGSTTSSLRNMVFIGLGVWALVNLLKK